MDLRIVNICNNDCLYCLESSLRKKEKFISKDELFLLILKNSKRDNITFYWWNPLLHPDILKIINFCKRNGYISIWILSNSNWINNVFLKQLMEEWLNSFWFYFNSFNNNSHNIVTWWWIKLNILLNNIKFISLIGVNIKIIIHVNNLNIAFLYKYIVILNKKYWIYDFDFVNYFPFDKPYIYKSILEYSIIDNKKEIIYLFWIINMLKLNVNFLKFSKDFFINNVKFYNHKNWIINQIWEEDLDRLSWKNKPFCLIEKRCINCFIKDNCKFYEL